MYCTMVLPYPATLAKLLVGYGKRRAGGGVLVYSCPVYSVRWIVPQKLFSM